MVANLVTLGAVVSCHSEDWAADFRALQLKGADFKAQLDYALRWARAEPDNSAAWTIVGANSDALGDYRQGAEGWQHVAELSPKLTWPLGNLANDYEHLGRAADAAATYQKLLTMPHDAPSDRLWKHKVTELAVAGSNTSLASAGGLPSGIPRAATAFSASVRNKWRSDAILNTILVRAEAGSFRTEFDFFSPSKNDGMTITVRGSQVNARGETTPNRESEPLPAVLLDLPEAVTKARVWGMEGDVTRATLYCPSRCSADGSGVIWSITSAGGKSEIAQGFEVPAYILSKEKFQRLLSAAERGDAQAQLAVARAYFEGLTGPPDAARTAAWGAKGAAQGNPGAENLLGQMHQFGYGVAQNPATAVGWYRAAASAGFAPAQYNLGMMYERGVGVAQDPVEARRWITMAERQGLPAAIAEDPIVNAAADSYLKNQTPPPGAVTSCGRMFIYSNVIHRCVPSSNAMLHDMEMAVSPDIPSNRLP